MRKDFKMPKYWVNLGSWEDLDFEEDEKTKEKLEESGGRIHGLANSVIGISGLVYKTEDLEDAKEVYLEAKKIIQEIFGEDAENYSMEFSITRQPECPKCGELGRFSAGYCSNCGIELIPKEDIEVD
jgi:hypothetical protein